MDAEIIKVLKDIKNELHAIRKAMEPEEVDIDTIIDAINKRTQKDGRSPLIL
ncbi:MAG: hypothetical protein IJJ38_00940 [Lachnospiraceae bacterium]|nr:hypothetical protein [Lachnospiraceae bacterium]